MPGLREYDIYNQKNPYDTSTTENTTSSLPEVSIDDSIHGNNGTGIGRSKENERVQRTLGDGYGDGESEIDIKDIPFGETRLQINRGPAVSQRQ